MTAKPIGLTQASGYQVGIRRTLPVALVDAWRFLIAPRGVRLWLGASLNTDLALGSPFQLADGTQGVVRVFVPESHLRLSWYPPNWQRPSTLQLRVMPRGLKTTIAFHQEQLPGAAEREQRHRDLLAALDMIEADI